MGSYLKTYCINLNRRSDRRLSMVEQFNNINFIDYYIVDAVDGDSIENPNENYHCQKVYGCLLSHRKAVEMAIQNDDDLCLICEDDIVFCNDLETHLQDIAWALPDDFDVCYLGYFDNGIKHEIYNKYLVKLNGQTGAFAYIVNKKFLPILKEYLNLNDGRTVDVILASIHKDYNFYCAYPFLVYVKSDYSDLSGHIVNYDDRIKKHFIQK